LQYSRQSVISRVSNPMERPAKSNREKMLGIAVLGITLAGIVFVTVIEPQLKERNARLARMGELQLKLLKMKGDLLIKDRIDNVYAKLEPMITSNGTELQEKALFIRELQDLYSKPDVSVMRNTVLPPTNEQFYVVLSAKIEMVGNIREIVRFALAVEGHPNPIKIEHMELKTRETDDNIHASFTLSKVVARPDNNTEGTNRVARTG
jgi:Tfp pilus assembly protein PilO